MMRALAYLLTMAGTIVVLAVVTIVFTIFVDPHRMFGTPTMVQREQCFLALTKLAVEHRIPLALYIHPYHARFLDVLDQFGLWQSFEDWKRHLLAQVSDFESDIAEIRLVDFSGYNELTMEAFRGPGGTRPADLPGLFSAHPRPGPLAMVRKG
jgi:hypothetical protein